MMENKEAQSLNPAPTTAMQNYEKSSIEQAAEAEIDTDFLKRFDADFAATTEVPERIGMFRVMPANKWMAEAKAMPDPVPLINDLWNEGELSCLFAPTGIGKSILAVQWAVEIAATGKRVLYYDAEMSKKCFQMRYTNTNGDTYEFPENFYRFERDAAGITTDSDEGILAQIEAVIAGAGAEVVIIDNLTALDAETEKAATAATLMQGLKDIKERRRVSMLVVAHTPKRSRFVPIDKCDLAGSHSLSDLFDSITAIGQSAQDENIRYLKQVKFRNGERTYRDDCVLVLQLVKDADGYLHYTDIGVEDERNILRPSDATRTALQQQVKELHGQGKSYRAIAAELGISKSLVGKILSTAGRETDVDSPKEGGER